MKSGCELLWELRPEEPAFIYEKESRSCSHSDGDQGVQLRQNIKLLRYSEVDETTKADMTQPETPTYLLENVMIPTQLQTHGKRAGRREAEAVRRGLGATLCATPRGSDASQAANGGHSWPIQ